MAGTTAGSSMHHGCNQITILCQLHWCCRPFCTCTCLGMCVSGVSVQTSETRTQLTMLLTTRTIASNVLFDTVSVWAVSPKQPACLAGQGWTNGRALALLHHQPQHACFIKLLAVMYTCSELMCTNVASFPACWRCHGV